MVERKRITGVLSLSGSPSKNETASQQSDKSFTQRMRDLIASKFPGLTRAEQKTLITAATLNGKSNKVGAEKVLINSLEWMQSIQAKDASATEVQLVGSAVAWLKETSKKRK